jgi:hypothetical protein
VPDVGELIGELVRLVGEVLSASSLRLGVGPTLGILGVLLVFLQLVARPVSRWAVRDPGGLAAAPRAMALAAEAGSAAVMCLGAAGLARSTSALARMQTLAALPILGHVARAAARGGVPLRVIVNDPMTAMAAAATLDEAHRRTATLERSGRSQVEFVGEGRGSMAARILADPSRPAAAFAIGDLGEEGLLVLDGLAAEAGSTSFGTANPSQAGSVLLTGDGAMIGPQPFQAPADLRTSALERTAANAANRLVALSVLVLLIGTLLALAMGIDVRAFLVDAA